MHQWGLAMPGGTEALVHRTGMVESLALESRIPPMVCFDLDLANIFGNIEWAEIRGAVAKHSPEAGSWVERSHQVPEAVVLLSGVEHLVN